MEFETMEAATLEINEEDTQFHNSLKEQKSTPNQNANPTSQYSVPAIPYFRIDAQSFFSYRNEIVEKALADCRRDLLSSNEEDDFVGHWLLTEITLWDTEKERIVLLTKTSLYLVKYDLISLRILQYNRITLENIDTLVVGKLVYPNLSLLPRLNGIAEGLSSIVQNVVFQQWSSFSNVSNSIQFVPKSRNTSGIRIMWNRGQPLSLEKKWNPFSKDVPLLTFMSHPLFWHKGSDSEKIKYDVEDIYKNLEDLLQEQCLKLKNDIVVENYVGIGSLLHNRNELGFFKSRGKVSF